MQLIDGRIPVCGEPIDPGALEQIRRCSDVFEHCLLMADHHKGYSVPIGGVVASQDYISPQATGFDIACGNKAVRLDSHSGMLRTNIEKIMDEVADTISFGMGRINNTKVDHALFDSDKWGHPAVAPHKEMARTQLGTVGSGNHYVDIFIDEKDRVWVGVHFGSRGLGHKTASWFLKEIGAKDDIDSIPVALHVKSDLGAGYLECMNLCGDYAYAGRDWVCQQVADIIKKYAGGNIVEEIHNHHNFAWLESHSGKDLWVVRKGATPAFPGQKGFIGGSMAEDAVIVEGVKAPLSHDLLFSTIHGAGRVMSRTQARGKTNRKTGAQISEGVVSKEMMREWVQKAGVTLRGADVDESPHCYKRLPEVLKYQGDTIKVLHTLSPIGVAMAGKDCYDPFKD
jgi:tRNA-splicing ligase RtcB (3'-phosphate/5'-hydroxy nucleic acid ligase)